MTSLTSCTQNSTKYIYFFVIVTHYLVILETSKASYLVTQNNNNCIQWSVCSELALNVVALFSGKVNKLFRPKWFKSIAFKNQKYKQDIYLTTKNQLFQERESNELFNKARLLLAVPYKLCAVYWYLNFLKDSHTTLTPKRQFLVIGELIAYLRAISSRFLSLYSTVGPRLIVDMSFS